MKLAFNLLPWREELEREAKQTYIRQTFLCALLGVVIAVVGYFTTNILVDQQNERNNLLVRAIADADEKIKEVRELESQVQVLTERKKIVESLQNNRNQAIRIMEQLGVRLPEGVFVTTAKQTGQNVRITGVALNQALVATTMTSLDDSDWFSEPVLIEIKSVDARTQAGSTVRASNFTLDIRYTNPSEVVLPRLTPTPAMQISRKLEEAAAANPPNTLPPPAPANLTPQQ